MLKRLKYIICTLILGVALLGLSPIFCIKVWCASNPLLTMTDIESGEYTRITSTISSINSDIKDSEKTGVSSTNMLECSTPTYSGSKYTFNIEFDTGLYSKLIQGEKQEVMSIILNSISDSSISQINRSKIYNFISNNDKSTSNLVRQLSNDVDADFADAYSSIKPFTGIIGWVLGVITLAIFIILGLTITVDIAYIVLPLFQNFLSSENEKTKPKFVSAEAWNAVKEAEAGGTFKEPLGIYLKLKTKQFLAIGICILYLVSGKIYTLIASIMDAFQGILG